MGKIKAIKPSEKAKILANEFFKKHQETVRERNIFFLCWAMSATQKQAESIANESEISKDIAQMNADTAYYNFIKQIDIDIKNLSFRCNEWQATK